jgi:16S rRNA (adenine1518-N6/adenine1519-N6)-dimethyltransferase
VAVETDPTLISVLQQELEDKPVIRVIEGDILKLDTAELIGRGECKYQAPLWGTLIAEFVVIANLPYYITAAVIRHILESRIRPRKMVVTVQREVALRMTAKPDEMSLLSVSTQFYSNPRIVMRLKPGAFHPAPKVESAVVSLELYENPPVPVDNIPAFFRIIRAGFSQKRKQLRNSLSAGLHLPATVVEKKLSQCVIDHRRRAETLSLVEWATVYQELSTVLKSK